MEYGRLASIMTLGCLLGCPAATWAAVTVDTSVSFKIQNANSGLLLTVSGASQQAGASAVQASSDAGQEQLWHFIPAGSGEYKIVNANSGQVLGISAGSKAAGATALQWADNGTNDHLWTVVSAGNSRYKLQNVNSGLVLGINGASTASGAGALQWTDNGTSDHLWTLISAGAAYPGPGAVTGNVVPVHDPSMVKTGSGLYYLYATGGGIQERQSTDRTNFTPSNLVYVFSPLPSWTAAYTNGVDLWAPDVSFHNGQYYLYYSASTFGSTKSAIGLATSPTGARGTWTDSGSPVLTSATCPGSNAIDPGLLLDSSGNWWLAFGSYSDGINMVRIDPTTAKPATSSSTCFSLARRLAGSAIEGSYVYPHGGFYYLFASVDACCNGVNSTYHIIVGRSSNPQGPYSDRGGLAMTQGGGTIVLATHGNIVGPGGQSLFKDNDGDILVYHYYDANNNGFPTLGVNLIGWTSDGWPYVR
jgi:arabinan endo-1,5-alpha-L-arabinosidase